MALYDRLECVECSAQLTCIEMRTTVTVNVFRSSFMFIALHLWRVLSNNADVLFQCTQIQFVQMVLSWFLATPTSSLHQPLCTFSYLYLITSAAFVPLGSSIMPLVQPYWLTHKSIYGESMFRLRCKFSCHAIYVCTARRQFDWLTPDNDGMKSMICELLSITTMISM